MYFDFDKNRNFILLQWLKSNYEERGTERQLFVYLYMYKADG